MWFTTETVEVAWGSDLMFVTLRGMKIEDKEHFFQVSKWWEVVENDAKTIEGNFVKIVNDEYDYDGRTIQSFKLFLNDWEDDICVSLGYNSVGKSIAMSLAWIENPWNLVISLSMNGKYKNATVINNWERANWFLTNDEKNELVRVIRDPETDEYIKTDDSKLIAKIKEALATVGIANATEDDVAEENVDITEE